MNIKLIAFSALVTSLVGAAIGVGTAEFVAPKYQSRFYQSLPPNYVYVGAATGLLVGGCQEAIRQLKKQRDEEETRLDRHPKA